MLLTLVICLSTVSALAGGEYKFKLSLLRRNIPQYSILYSIVWHSCQFPYSLSGAASDETLLDTTSVVQLTAHIHLVISP